MPKNRRRAIHCELLEPSKTSPGYYKYQIKIRELDGSEHVVPAYGKDMQDAIERLLWNERVESVMEKKATVPIIVILGLAIVFLFGALSFVKDKPIFILIGILIIILIAVIINRIDSYLKK